MAFDPTRFGSAKDMEGQRLAPLFAAVGALPSAALVLGKDVAPGSPLFLAAAFVSCAAYAFWQLTDNAHYVEQAAYHEDDPVHDRVERFSYHLQHSTVAYTAVSLLLTGLGFAGIYSSWRTSISIEIGFVAASLALIAATAHYIGCMLILNQIIERYGGDRS